MNWMAFFSHLIVNLRRFSCIRSIHRETLNSQLVYSSLHLQFYRVGDGSNWEWIKTTKNRNIFSASCSWCRLHATASFVATKSTRWTDVLLCSPKLWNRFNDMLSSYATTDTCTHRASSQFDELMKWKIFQGIPNRQLVWTWILASIGIQMPIQNCNCSSGMFVVFRFAFLFKQFNWSQERHPPIIPCIGSISSCEANCMAQLVTPTPFQFI